MGRAGRSCWNDSARCLRQTRPSRPRRTGGSRCCAARVRPCAAGELIFAAEAFGEHGAFLRRLQARGLLVAAGPLPDEPSAGMTVVRVPAADAGLDLELLANTDDRSVALGFLTVHMRPWEVRFT